MEKRSQAKPGQYLTFMLKGQFYGVPIATVREINRVSDITPVPQTPHFVAGVINLRGKVIPVVNLRQKFELPKVPYDRETCIIVIEGTDGQVGMIVDSVSAVVELTDAQIEGSPTLGSDSKLDFVMGMGKMDDKVIILVDIVSALSKDQFSMSLPVEKATDKAAEKTALPKAA